MSTNPQPETADQRATAEFWYPISLVVAFVLTVPVNRYMISRRKGHAAAPTHHH
jgi:hypothetical protein